MRASDGHGPVPLDLEHRAAVLIDEDDSLAKAVIDRMVEPGVPVLDRPPW